MKKNLTLTIKVNIIRQAKSYAKSTNRSLSEIVESYLESITKEVTDRENLSPRLRKIVGAVKLPEGCNKI